MRARPTCSRAAARPGPRSRSSPPATRRLTTTSATPSSLSGDTAVVGARHDDHAGGMMRARPTSSGSPPTAGPYCTAGTSASGCQALLSAWGRRAPRLRGLRPLGRGRRGPEGRPLLLRHERPAGEPLGQRHELPVRRAAGRTRADPCRAVGTIGACDGSFALDLNALWCQSLPVAPEEPRRRRRGPSPALVPRPAEHEQPDHEPVGRDRVCGGLLRGCLLRTSPPQLDETASA